MPRQRILFFGSGAFGLPTLERLTDRHHLLAVFTQPSRPAGRKRVLTPTPVAAWAMQRGLPVHEAVDVNADVEVARIAAYGADASVVIAFGQKLAPATLLTMGRLAVNLHGSLLPAYRGAAPVQRAVMDAVPTSGVSVIGLAQTMDAGDVYGQASLRIGADQTSGDVHDALAALGPDAVLEVLDDLAAGTLHPLPQPAGATRAPKLTKAEGTLEFDQPAERVRARINGLNPWPGCRVVRLRDGVNEPAVELMLRRADRSDGAAETSTTGGVDAEGRVRCADGSVRILEVQRPGRNVVPWAAFAASGWRAGDRFNPIG